MEKLTTKQTTKKMTKQTTELAGWRAGWLANPVVVTDKLRHRAWKDEKSRSCIGDEFLGCKSGVQKAGNSQKGMAYSIQRNPPPKKSPKHRTNNNSNKSNEVLLIARRLQQHTRRYSRPKILLHALHSQKWVLILGRSRSGRHPKSAGFSWIAQLRFGPHFLEELGGRSSSCNNNNNKNG